MLLTPLLSASPLVVPPLAKNDQAHYLVNNLRQDKPIANNNLRSIPIIRNWSDKPPDSKQSNSNTSKHDTSTLTSTIGNETSKGVNVEHVNKKDELKQFEIPLKHNNLSSSSYNTSNLIDVVFNNSKFLSILSTESGIKNQKLITRSIKTQHKYHSNSNTNANNSNLQYNNNKNNYSNNHNNRTTNNSYWINNNYNLDFNDKISDSVLDNYVNSNYSKNSNLMIRRSYDSNYDNQYSNRNSNNNKNIRSRNISSYNINNNNNNDLKIQENFNNRSSNNSNNNNTEIFYSKNNKYVNNQNSEFNRTNFKQHHDNYQQQHQQHQQQQQQQNNNNQSFRDNTSTHKTLPSSGYHTTSSFLSYGYLILVFIVSIILLISVASIIRCLRTRGATRALALPISPLSDDQTPLNAEPDIAVPMLSVQTPGCAGMERLGVPARSVPTRDDINHRRTFPHHDLMISTNRTNQSTGSSKSQQSSSSSGTSRSNPLNSRQTFDDQNHQLLCSYNKNRCPHHIALPDGERGPDRDFQIRTPCQQEEIPRTYVKAPPNKTIKDVPDAQCYHLHSSASSCNLNGRGVSLSNLGNSNLSSSAGKNDKSNKPLSLFKYFLRINNSGSNNNNHHSNSNNSQNHKSESHHSLSTFGSKSNNNNNMSVTPATSLNNMVLVNGGLGFNGSTNHSILHSNLHNNLNNYTTSATTTTTSTTSFRTSTASGPGATTSTTVGTTELSSSISSSSSTSSGPEKSSNNFL